MSLALLTGGYISDDSGGVTYRMRGFDEVLGRHAFWNSEPIDSTGAGYTGPGPLVDIVVQQVVGKAA